MPLYGNINIDIIELCVEDIWKVMQIKVSFTQHITGRRLSILVSLFQIPPFSYQKLDKVH